MVDPAVKATYPLRLGRSFDSKASPSNDQFYALQYSFKPDSIDRSRPMTLAKDNDQFYIDQCQENKDQKQEPDGSAENRRYFVAQQSEATPVDCLLFYDESTNSFILNHLASTLRLNPSRRSHKGPGLAQTAGEHNATPRISQISDSHNNSVANVESPSEVAPDNASSSQSNPEKLPLGSQKENDTKTVLSKVKPSSKAKQAKLPSTPPLRRPPPASQVKKSDSGQTKAAPTKTKAKIQSSEIALPMSSSTEKVKDNVDDDEDDDLDLLANELEDSLGNDSKTEASQVVIIDEPEDHTQDPATKTVTNSSSDKSRPISLRQFTFARRPHEEDLSSSEEE